jgi:hypothetical protein
MIDEEDNEFNSAEDHLFDTILKEALLNKSYPDP